MSRASDAGTGPSGAGHTVVGYRISDTTTGWLCVACGDEPDLTEAVRDWLEVTDRAAEGRIILACDDDSRWVCSLCRRGMTATAAPAVDADDPCAACDEALRAPREDPDWHPVGGRTELPASEGRCAHIGAAVLNFQVPADLQEWDTETRLVACALSIASANEEGYSWATAADVALHADLEVELVDACLHRLCESGYAIPLISSDGPYRFAPNRAPLR